MNNIVKFGLLFVLLSVVLSFFGTYITLVFDLFGGGLNYVVTGSVGQVITAIITWVGWFLDTLFLSTTTTYVTFYGGYSVYSLSWLFTIVRVLFGVSIVVLLLNLIIERK